MAENKTKPTGADVAAFLEAVPDRERREDAKALCALMERLSGEPPVLWGPGLVGFGQYRYRYDSGREGEAGRIGFSPRARELVLYFNDGFEERGERLARLGRHRTGKCCLYVRRLAEIDMAVLEEMVADSLARMRERYPD